jgi:hypothetical protein
VAKKSFTVERISRDQLRAELDGLERAHEMTSATFLERWTHGELDSVEYTWWAGLCRMAVRARILEQPHSVPSAFPKKSGAVPA